MRVRGLKRARERGRGDEEKQQHMFRTYQNVMFQHFPVAMTLSTIYATFNSR